MESDQKPYFWLGLDADEEDATQQDRPIMRFGRANTDPGSERLVTRAELVEQPVLIH